MRDKKIRQGQIVYYQGEAPNFVSIIKRGVIRSYTILPNGNEVNIAVYGKGDYFPIETPYDTSPVTVFYYEALSNCVIVDQTIEEFQSERDSNPDTVFIDNRRYIGALMHVNAIGQTTAFEKLGHALRYLGMRFGKPLVDKHFVRIDIKLTQQDLANLCTISRETTNIELTNLKDTGYVIERNKYYAVNLEGLNKLLGEEEVDLDL